MSDACTVIIAAPRVLASLKERVAADGGEVVAFTDSEALRALEVIMTRRPAVVTLEQLFAATPRGAALINRIKADPSLLRSEIRVVAYDVDQAPASPATPAVLAELRVVERSSSAPVVGAPLLKGQGTLDPNGTRRAPRVAMATGVEVLVDGNAAALVDLSTVGAQVVSASVLKPNQRVRISMTDEKGTLRFGATVAWANFEIPANVGPRYRAGLEFIDADARAIDAYSLRHKA